MLFGRVKNYTRYKNREQKKNFFIFKKNFGNIDSNY